MTLRLSFLHFFISLLLLFPLSSCFAQERKLTSEQVEEDLYYLKNQLESFHPNLYTYSSQDDYEGWLDNKITGLQDSTSYLESYLLISSISKVIKDGHSYIYPSQEHLDSFFNSATLLPFDFKIVDKKLLVDKDFSNESILGRGVIILSINGNDFAETYKTLIDGMPRDGNNLEYPKHLLSAFFPAYYSYLYGFPKKYSIKYLDKHGIKSEVFIQGLSRKEIRVQRDYIDSKPQKGIELNIHSTSKAAILRIASFDNSILKSDYDQRFITEIKSAFEEIKERNITYLAIDLRGNQGGELSNGVFLLQHIMLKPFQSVKSLSKLKKGGQRKTKYLQNKWVDSFRPKSKNHFDGQVALLIDGGSFSCSAIVANTFSKNHRGEIIGSMTGGSAFFNSGGPNKSITLPNSKILFNIPLTRYQLQENQLRIGKGVNASIHVSPTIMDVLGEHDPYLEAFINIVPE